MCRKLPGYHGCCLVAVARRASRDLVFPFIVEDYVYGTTYCKKNGGK